MVIKNVASLGSGLMGRQIAANAAKYGFKTTMYCHSASSVAKVTAWFEEYLEGRIAKKRVTEAEAKQWRDNLAITDSMEEAVKDADLVIESLLENYEAKRAGLTEAAKYTKPECIITTNSSRMPSSMFMDCVKDPSKLCNMHFFNPALVMELVEVVVNPKTSKETADTVMEVSRQMGKSPILVTREIEGFIVNRILGAVAREAEFLVDQGYCTPQEVDTAMEKGANYPMGPFRLMDLTGIDLSVRGRYERWQKSKDPADKPAQFLIDQYLSGNYGRKTGKGWYDYTK